MNTTTIFEQARRCTNDPNGPRVPHLFDFPEKHHDLFLKLGKDRLIESFEARHVGKAIELKIWLREGEKPNLVVMQRFKRLFHGVKNVKFPAHMENQPIHIQIPN
tara:strand:- start:1437 stop:1751 length:315 start_codon:yes stop_codon:yes gene_type:complete